MSAVDNYSKPPIPDKPTIPDIKKCFGYWYEGMGNLAAELTDLCQVGRKPPLQCMFDQPEFCKGLMLRELTRGHDDHRLGHSNRQESQLAKIDSDAEEGAGRNDDQGLTRSSSTSITPIERRLLWRAAFGQDPVCKESEKSENRTVKAIFLQWLLTNPEAVKLISTNGIHAEKIIIEGDLNLENVTINFPVLLEESHFLGSINLTDAKTSSLSLKGSTCSSTFKAKRITVKGSFCLDRFKAERGIDIRGANISGDLDCREGHFIDKRCDLRLMFASDGNAEDEFIRKFKMEFESKKKECAVLIVHATINPEKWTIAGFNDAGEFRTVVINDSNHELSKELKKDPRNERRIVELATSSLGSTQNKVYALDTSLAEVGGEVCFNSFKVTGHVLALEMKVGGDFDCTGGRIEHKTSNCHAISIDRSIIGGDLLLCQGFSAVGQVRLIGTKITGDLDCSGGKFDFFNEKDRNALYAPRAKVDGSVYLCGSRKENLPEEDFVVKGRINLEFTNINHSIKIGKHGHDGKKTSIFFRGGDKGDTGINLENAKITDSLELVEVQSKETKFKLEGRGATVGRLVINKGEFVETELDLRGANVGHLVFTEGEFGGGIINLESAKITGSLEWSEVKLTKETELDLRGANVGHLVTKGGEKSWPDLYLDGFVYDRIEHQGLDNNYKTHLNWLRKQVTPNGHYYLPGLAHGNLQRGAGRNDDQGQPNPQIYEQLATVLRRSGQDADAKEISIEKERIRHKSGQYWWLNPFMWLWRSIGYGYKAYRALIVAVVFILLGGLIFDKAYTSGIMVPIDKKAYDDFISYYTNHHKVPPSANYYVEHNQEPPSDVKPLLNYINYTEFEPLVYSFDAFLPIGKLQQQEKWHPDDHKKIEITIPYIGNKISFTLRHYLYFFHAPLGWLLTTLGLAGLLQTIVRNK